MVGLDKKISGAGTVLDGLVDALHESGRLQVWSIIVTLFGDAVVPRGGSIGAGALQEILSYLKIGPNTVRTALSRLAKDGWLVRQKSGRQSRYSLAPEGHELFESASRRIYASAAPMWNGDFQFVMLANATFAERDHYKQEARKLGYGCPLPGLFVKPVTADESLPQDEKLIFLEIGRLETSDMDAFRSRSWDLSPLEELYLDFHAGFVPLREQIQRSDDLLPEECLAARLLLIHQWRRIVLKDPGLPTELLPKNWPGEPARGLVRDLYHLIAKKSDACLALHCPISKENEHAHRKIIDGRFK